ncbi:MAG: acyl carrier protein [Desulfovibrio sp.]|nr:acyl carrier protein [Desulfovibrio sp.]
MNIDEFLEELKTLMQRDGTLTPDMALRDVPEWDSLAIMGCMAFLHGHFGLRIPYSRFGSLNTVEDVAALAKGAIR